MDVYQENEELKEELSKLAAKVGSKILFNILITSLSKKFWYQSLSSFHQVEFYKIVGMVSTNHHIKKQKSPHFSISQSPKPVNYVSPKFYQNIHPTFVFKIPVDIKSSQHFFVILSFHRVIVSMNGGHYFVLSFPCSLSCAEHNVTDKIVTRATTDQEHLQ